MEYNQSPNNVQYVVDSSVTSAVMSRVFLWMTAALAITALTTYLSISSGLVYNLSSGYFYALIIGELLLVMGISAAIKRETDVTLSTALFVVYSVFNGLTMSVIGLLYDPVGMLQAFCVTAGTFGATAAFGYFTKRDLSSWRNFLFMGLIGLIIAGLANLFFKSSALAFISSIVGVLIFMGLTAYDVYKVKAVLEEVALSGADVEHPSLIKKIALWGALNLYLDFVNLFLYILRLLGRSRN